MNQVSVSLVLLYEFFNVILKFGEIVKSNSDGVDYYDLYVNGNLVCMDGEECEVIDENEQFITYKNSNSEKDHVFILTKRESDLLYAIN